MKKLLALLLLPAACFFAACASNSNAKSTAKSASAQTKTEEGKSANGLEMKLVLGTSAYVLPKQYDNQGFRDMAEKAAKGEPNKGKNPFESPEIAGNLVFKNTSNKSVSFYLPNNDSVQLSYDVKGPGAVKVTNLMPMTMEYRTGTSYTLKPGEETSWYVKNLNGGMRSQTESNYWIKPGEYTIRATYTWNSESGKVMLISPAVKVTVK